MSSGKKQESIWTSLSRQQRRASARLQPKRLAADEDGASDALLPLTVAKKKQRTSEDVVVTKEAIQVQRQQEEEEGDEEEEAGDAGIVTDGEHLSQEDIEIRDTDSFVSEATIVTGMPAGRVYGVVGEYEYDVAGDHAMVDGWGGRSVTGTSRDQHFVTPEKHAIYLNSNASAVSIFTPRTAKIPLHEKKKVSVHLHTFSLIIAMVADLALLPSMKC